MPRLTCSLLLFFFCGHVLAAITARDYAFQSVLGETDQQLQRVELPVQVIQHLARSDMSDIAVFNVNGKRLPHTVIPTPDIVAERDLELPFHEFDRFLKQRSKTVTTREQSRQDGSISELQTTETLAVQSVRKDYLIELKPDDRSRKFERIELQWTHEPETQVLQIKVEAGNELDSLRTINARKSLTNRESDDIKWRSIRGIPGDQKYLRLSPVSEVDSFELKKVIGHYQETSTAPRLTIPVELETTAEDDGLYYSFASPSAVAAEAMRIVPADVNSIINGDLYATWQNTENRVRIRSRFQQHNLSSAEVKPSQPIKLPTRAYHRIWFTSNEELTSLPRVELIYRQYEAYFLGDGSGPYTLTWGNHEAEPQAANLTTLLQHNLSEAKNQVATVTLGPVHEAGGPTRLAPQPILPWKKWLLWTLLIVAVIVTGRMAYRLLREMSADSPA